MLEVHSAASGSGIVIEDKVVHGGFSGKNGTEIQQIDRTPE
jgi:hypothetical protein